LASPPDGEHLSTIEVARMLGMAVRSVQLMVDRGLLQAWRTPGGHRRIDSRSVQRWLAERNNQLAGPAIATGALDGSPDLPAPRPGSTTLRPLRVLLIEDSSHFQTLVGLVVGQHLPQAELHIADDGIAGLALAGKLEPDVLLVDIVLPGIDGATLITSLRSHPQFSHIHLVVVTGLDHQALAPYAFALSDVPVVRKVRLVEELPPLLWQLASAATAGRTAIQHPTG
jgi:excisionase family DNA binding protein